MHRHQIEVSDDHESNYPAWLVHSALVLSIELSVIHRAITQSDPFQNNIVSDKKQPLQSILST